MIRAARTSHPAFTLVELLIVVAILAILAAIAVPNLLDAQTRSKVSRVKSDLRTLAVAIETYTADHNDPPLDWSVSRGEPQYDGMLPNTSGVLFPGYVDPGGRLHPGLTTPVAYVSNCWITDPFASGASYAQIPFDQQKYTYNLFREAWGVEPAETYVMSEYAQFYGAWRLGSMGPDRDIYNGSSLSQTSRVYDPTNGAVSAGNIWRSAREPEVHGRPRLDEFIDS